MPFWTCKKIRDKPHRAVTECCAVPILSTCHALDCTSGVSTGLHCSPSPVPWPQSPDTAEWFLSVMARKRDSNAVIQPGYIPDQRRPDSQLQPGDVAPLFHVTLQAALSYQTMYTLASFITTCPIRSGKVNQGGRRVGVILMHKYRWAHNSLGPFI